MKNNTAYFFVFMFWVFSVNAQSKKEQIKNLNYQIDSLNQVLLKEQKLNRNSTFEISQLNAELTRLNESISSLNAEVSKLTSSLKSNQEELFKLQYQLKVKSDSLEMIKKVWYELQPHAAKVKEELNNLIGTYTSDISKGWTKNFNVTKGKQYLLVVSGQFSLGTICPKFEMDPAYWIPPNNSGNALRNSCNTSWYIKDYCNGNLAIRPTPDVYNPLHAYNYVITANSNIIVVGFTDTYYGDNCGSITFSLYECLDCTVTNEKASQEDNLKINQPTNPIKIVTIGTQVWMTKNLDVSTFRNGDPIPEAKTNEEWEAAANNKQPAWCYLDFNQLNGEKFGKLYNWYAVNDHRGLAPNGYHIPKEDEWEILLNFIGRDNTTKLCSSPEYRTEVSFVDEGGYYEEKWVVCQNCRVASQEYKKICPSCKGNGGKYVKTGKFIPKTKRKVEKKIQIGGWEGSNESGFSALPAGGKAWGDGFYERECAFWTSTESPDNYDYWGKPYKIAKLLWLSNGGYGISKMNQEYGYSVRCIKD